MGKNDIYRVMFEKAGHGILVADLETMGFVQANPAICSMLGYSREELLGLSVKDIHPEKDLQHVVAEFEAQARGEKLITEDIPCLRKDGTVFYADIVTSSGIIDGQAYNIGFFEDITERHRAAQALAESEVRFREFVDLLPLPLYEADLTGRIIFTNRAAFETFGYDQGDLEQGVSLFSLIGP